LISPHNVRPWRRLSLALYLLFYLCILVPGHTALFVCADDWACPAGPCERVEHPEDTPDHPGHDPQTCQICLHGGQLHSLATTIHWDPSLQCVDIAPPVSIESVDRPIAHQIASRAPPVGA
jgi:hypothetical protein